MNRAYSEQRRERHRPAAGASNVERACRWHVHPAQNAPRQPVPSPRYPQTAQRDIELYRPLQCPTRFAVQPLLLFLREPHRNVCSLGNLQCLALPQTARLMILFCRVFPIGRTATIGDILNIILPPPDFLDGPQNTFNQHPRFQEPETLKSARTGWTVSHPPMPRARCGRRLRRFPERSGPYPATSAAHASHKEYSSSAPSAAVR